MPFKKHDTVVIFSQPDGAGGGPRVGMKGFIDEVHTDDYYTFAYLGNLPDGLQGVPARTYAVGVIHGKYLAHDDAPLLIEHRDEVLRDRDERFKEMMAKYHLKNIIGGNEDE